MSTRRLAFALVALAATAHADDKTAPGKTQTPPSKSDTKSDSKAVFFAPGELKWAPAPPVLPKNAQIAVLFGDPMKPGRFTVRLRAPDGYKIPPHWHTQDEAVTVLQGKVVMHMGDSMTADAHDMDAGSYHYLPGGMHHGAEIRGDTIIQLEGQGPFDIHYINPADNPTPQNASAKR